MAWKGDTTSILVLNQIQVDPPYEPDNCTIIAPSSNGVTVGVAKNILGNGKGALEDGSLDRVRKIVVAAAADATTGEANS